MTRVRLLSVGPFPTVPWFQALSLASCISANADWAPRPWAVWSGRVKVFIWEKIRDDSLKPWMLLMRKLSTGRNLAHADPPESQSCIWSITPAKSWVRTIVSVKVLEKLQFGAIIKRIIMGLNTEYSLEHTRSTVFAPPPGYGTGQGPGCRWLNSVFFPFLITSYCLVLKIKTLKS